MQRDYQSIATAWIRDDVRDNPRARYIIHLMMIDLSGGLLTVEEDATLLEFQITHQRKVTP